MRLAAIVFLLLSAPASVYASTPDAGQPEYLEAFARRAARAAVPLREWRQAMHAVRHTLPEARAWPDGASIRAVAGSLPAGVIPLALLDVRGAAGGPADVFAATALVPATRRGAGVSFALDADRVFTTDPSAVLRFEFDADDGRGWRPLSLNAPVRASYAVPGMRRLGLRAFRDDGSVRTSAFAFRVEGLTVPDPDDTLDVTATIPYQSELGTGRAYVYLADGHTALTNPIVVVEGFDLDNSLAWDGLYTLLNQADLLETLRGLGYDAVVLDFTDATDYIQKNAYVLVELLAQVRAAVPPATELVVAGASMGGLVARYALAYMEQQAIPHDTRLFISFDAPHRGANIPLGIQYWVDLFAGESAEAAFLLGRLNRPASRQMLVYHLTDPPGSTGESDPLKGVLDSELSGLGGQPAQPRLVAIANGSGSAVDQGFLPGDQIIEYDYDTLLLDLIGNVWAVPNGGSAQILEGRIFIFLIANVTKNVSVTGTAPYDNAPGGFRTTMADMDSTPAPAGDIIALHPNHAFIPTVSALDLDTTDLFHDVAADTGALTLTPFDAIYYPAVNQEHVSIDAQTAMWIVNEVQGPVVSVPQPPSGRALALALAPNPFRSRVNIDFRLNAAGPVRLAVYGVDGRRMATLATGVMPAGSHRVRWDGRDARGRTATPGLLFLRLEAGGASITRRLVFVR